jgi:hypothetical protein
VRPLFSYTLTQNSNTHKGHAEMFRSTIVCERVLFAWRPPRLALVTTTTKVSHSNSFLRNEFKWGNIKETARKYLL